MGSSVLSPAASAVTEKLQEALRLSERVTLPNCAGSVPVGCLGSIRVKNYVHYLAGHPLTKVICSRHGGRSKWPNVGTTRRFTRPPYMVKRGGEVLGLKIKPRPPRC